jgi:hypothetical protein
VNPTWLISRLSSAFTRIEVSFPVKMLSRIRQADCAGPIKQLDQ